MLSRTTDTYVHNIFSYVYIFSFSSPCEPYKLNLCTISNSDGHKLWQQLFKALLPTIYNNYTVKYLNFIQRCISKQCKIWGKTKCLIEKLSLLKFKLFCFISVGSAPHLTLDVLKKIQHVPSISHIYISSL
jgi:hypothetical protein